MSADEILAANLWPWPDPLLKRDRNGQVLFVNAAFLQLYGGRIEDWRGNVISGWPAPAQQGAQRFETRAGDPAHETIYDWVEMVMADGNAMAVARNVTDLLAAAAQATPAAAAPIAETPPSPPPAEAPVAAAPTAPALEPANTAAAPAAHAPVVEPTPEVEAEADPAPVFNTGPEASEPAEASPSTDFEETLGRSADDYLQEEGPELAAPAPAPEASSGPNLDEAEKSRLSERRALPIEDSAAVLGSNWRDQVIAKAIGAEATEEEGEDTETEEAPDISTDAKEDGGKVGDGLKILLAEDNAINALLTRTLLEAEGAKVDTVEDGALAVEAVKKAKYDLIFMDMRMPNMDGLESTRKIRALGGDYATMPIVALTANAFDDDRNACFDSGMNDFMTKPVSAEELEEMVANWTKKDRPEEKLAS